MQFDLQALASELAEVSGIFNKHGHTEAGTLIANGNFDKLMQDAGIPVDLRCHFKKAGFVIAALHAAKGLGWPEIADDLAKLPARASTLTGSLPRLQFDIRQPN